MNTHTDPQTTVPSWQQIVIEFNDDRHAERIGIEHVGPSMNDAEHTGIIASWFFIRKASQWRLRYLPTGQDATPEARALTQHTLDTLRSAGHITRWAETIYEPETHAFGGTAAMDIAHHLFHLDSRHILNYLGSDHAAPSEGDKRRELSILLVSTLMRAAGQDLYEQGDIWARLTDNRPPASTPNLDHTRKLTTAVHRLITVDAGPASALVAPDGPLAHLAAWTTAFHATGTALVALARNGTLRRGIRAVLTHHVLFHWNRIGLPHQTQALLAHAAKMAVLGE